MIVGYMGYIDSRPVIQYYEVTVEIIGFRRESWRTPHVPVVWRQI